MAKVQSRLTAQGQISVPAEIRKKLGLGAGSIIEWDDKNGEVVVRRAGKFSSADLHEAAFPEGAPKAVSAKDVKTGIAKYMRKKHARH